MRIGTERCEKLGIQRPMVDVSPSESEQLDTIDFGDMRAIESLFAGGDKKLGLTLLTSTKLLLLQRTKNDRASMNHRLATLAIRHFDEWKSCLQLRLSWKRSWLRNGSRIFQWIRRSDRCLRLFGVLSRLFNYIEPEGTGNAVAQFYLFLIDTDIWRHCGHGFAHAVAGLEPVVFDQFRPSMWIALRQSSQRGSPVSIDDSESDLAKLLSTDSVFWSEDDQFPRAGILTRSKWYLWQILIFICEFSYLVTYCCRTMIRFVRS